MRVLSVGWFQKKSSTSLHRHVAIKKNVQQVDEVELGTPSTTFLYKVCYHLFQKGLPISLPDQVGSNKKIKALIAKEDYDIVWIDKGVIINASTLKFIKEKSPTTKIVSFSPDNMVLRHNQSQNYLNCIPYYDCTFTTKSYILDDLKNMGVKNIHFIHKTFSEDFHCPQILTEEEKERLGGDVGFVGVWEQERCDSILFLVKNGLNVKVFGDGKWNEYKGLYPNLVILPGIFSEDYPKALQAFKISLCFLRKKNFDQQTARTMEIPACGGFMLAERTKEHLQLFKENKEAVFFSDNEELLEKCRLYLGDYMEREKIALAGRNRCLNSGYSNKGAMGKMLNIVMKND